MQTLLVKIHTDAQTNCAADKSQVPLPGEG
jgi:hypothetical protein